MLLVISSSLISQIDTNPDVATALELIAQSRRCGNHLVLGEASTLKCLADCGSLSQTARGVYRKLYNDWPTIQAYLNKFSTRVEIFSGDVFETSMDKECKVLKIPVKYFTDISLASETVFMSENQDDLLFYEKLTNAYLLWKDLGNIYIKYEGRGGGGNTTAKEFGVIQQGKKRFCLCVTDSDRKTPNLNIGDTAKALYKINDKTQPLCELLILNAREIENIIPTSIYQEVFGDDVNKMDAVSFLMHLENSDFAEVRKYFDMKKGLRLEQILNISPEKEFHKYWLDVANKFSRIDLSNDCLGNLACYENPCQCIITPGFGENILSSVINNCVKVKSAEDLSYMVCELLKPEWERVGATITAWCCASLPIAAV